MNALEYEAFITKAQNCEQGEIEGADASEWNTLIESERDANQGNASNADILGFQDHLQEVKHFVYDAFKVATERLFEKDGDITGISALAVLATRATNAKNTSQLSSILEEGMALLNKHGIDYEY